MNKKVMQNKAFLMSHAIDRKKMYKVGSQWVIGSALVLLLVGGASLAHHVTANADTTVTTKVAQSGSAKSITSASTINKNVTSASNNTSHTKSNIPTTSPLNLGDKGLGESEAQSYSQNQNNASNNTNVSSANIQNIHKRALTLKDNITRQSNGNSSIVSSASMNSQSSKASNINGSIKASSLASTNSISASTTNKLASSANSVDNKDNKLAKRRPLIKTAKSGTTKRDTDTIIFEDADGNLKNVEQVSGNDGSIYNLPSSYSFKDPSSDNSDNSVEFNLASNQNNSFKFNNGEHFVTVALANTPSHNIPYYDEPVTFEGNVALDFYVNGNSYKTLYLPYIITTKVRADVANVLKGTNPSATVPSDYINKIIQQFNTNNYTYAGNANAGEYDGVYVDPTTNGKFSNDNNNLVFNNGNIVLQFNANDNIPENIHYQFSDNGNHNETTNGTQTVNGTNDAQGDINKTNDSGLEPGWHLVHSDNTFTYGNGGSDASGKINDSDNVNVAPDTANATVQYQVSDGSTKSTNNGDVLNKDEPFSASGWNYQAKDANGYQGKNTSVKVTSDDGIPEGYHIAPNQDTNVPFDNTTHTIKIIGNSHNASDKDTTPSSTKPTTLADQSDLVQVNEVEYDNGQQIRTLHQYVAVSGSTGESYTLSPYNFTPNGYQVTPNEQNQGGIFSANGISNKNIVFNYDAKIGTDISVNYINQNGLNIRSRQITGNVDDTGNVLKVHNAGMPAGYHYVSVTDNGNSINGASSTDIPYRITTSGQNIIITVAGNAVTPKTSILPKHPTVPSDTPNKPSQPSDASDTPSNPQQPTNPNKPSDNPEIPTQPNGKPNNTSTTPNGQNTTPNQPDSNKLVPKDPNDANDTFYVVINDFGYDRTDSKYDKLERQYVKRLTPAGEVGNTFNVTPVTYVTQGYSQNASDNDYEGYFGADGLYQAVKNSSGNITQGAKQNSIVWNYTANAQTAPVTFTNQAGNKIGQGTLIGHTDSDINPTNPNDGGIQIPKGYHLPPNSNYNYFFNKKNTNNNPSANYKLQGNTIKGTANVSLVYEESDGHVDSTGNAQILINTQVGSTITVDPLKYWKANYNQKNSVWTIPTNSDIAPNSSDTNYNPTHTFTYVGTRAGDLNVNYVDKTPGSAEYNQVTDHQDLGTNLGPVGTIIDLGDSTTPADHQTKGVRYILNLPKYAVLVHPINPIQLTKGELTLNVGLMMPREFKPASKANQPTSKATNSSSKTSQSNSASIKPTSIINNNNSSSELSSLNSKLAYDNSELTSLSKQDTNNSSMPTSNTNPVISTPTNASNNPDNIKNNSDITIKPSSYTNNSIKPSSDNAPQNNHDTINQTQTNSDIPATNNITKATNLRNIPINNTNYEPSDNTTPLINNSIGSTNDPITFGSSEPVINPSINSNHINNAPNKLPQTNEANKYVDIMALVASLFGLGLASVDIDRKHSL